MTDSDPVSLLGNIRNKTGRKIGMDLYHSFGGSSPRLEVPRPFQDSICYLARDFHARQGEQNEQSQLQEETRLCCHTLKRLRIGTAGPCRKVQLVPVRPVRSEGG